MAGAVIALVVSAFSSAILSGCAAYRWGEPPTGAASRPTLAGTIPSSATLFVPPPTNASFAPQIHVPLATALREALLRRGHAVASRKSADLLLDWEVIDYQQIRFSGTLNDSGRPRSLDLNLHLRVSLKDAKTGEALVRDREITARRRILSDSGLSEAERQAIPILAEDIARQIADLLITAPPKP
jgi:hypothetical protein